MFQLPEHLIQIVQQTVATEDYTAAKKLELSQHMLKPHMIYKPVLTLDGNAWIALFGANLQEGVAGWGETPALAMESFDKAWRSK